MKLDEFAFLNQQLAGMLRAGIPLEGGLRELSSTMRRGDLRNELEALEKDLTAGAPLGEAVSRRKLPALYVRLTQAGVAGGDLPGVLTLLADYYNRLATVMTRLKGLMVYPGIVLLLGLGVSILVTYVYRVAVLSILSDTDYGPQPHRGPIPGMMLPTLVLAGLAASWFIIMGVPRFRQWARWKLPGFREASLAQFAGAASLLLQSGATLQGTLGLLQKTEGSSPAGRELARWMELHQQGEAKWTHFTVESKVFPPLFRWVVAQGGEDLALGFQRAGEIYQARSAHRIDVLLYAAMPMAILFVAGVVAGQMYPIILSIRDFFYALGL